MPGLAGEEGQRRARVRAARAQVVDDAARDERVLDASASPDRVAPFVPAPSRRMPGVKPRMTELKRFVRALRRMCAPRRKLALMVPVGRCVRGPRMVTFENDRAA